MKLQFKVSLRCALAMFLMIPIPVWADHVPTQEPYGYNESINTETGALTLSILSSDGFEDSPPEKYTIFFAMSSGVSTSSFCVSTSFGHVTNTWQDYVFSIGDLRTYFELPVGTFYYRIRSDNDTDNSFSTLSSERSIALPNQTPFSDSQTDWSAPTNTCNDTATTTTTTTTTTTVPDTTTTSSTSSTTTTSSSTTTTSSSTTTTSSSTTTTTTTSSTTTTTLPPPPPPPPPPTTTTTLYIVVNDDGSESEYTETEVKDGTVERDEERKENENLYGCYMTNAQIERGDCDIPEEKEEETIIIIEDEKRDDTEEELFDDDDLVLEVDIDDEIKESKPEEEEIIPEEKIEINIEEIEEEFEFEEEEIIIPEDIEIPEEIEIIIIEEEEILDEEIITDDTREDQPEEVGTIFEDRPDELGRDETETIELSEEELKKEIEELEEVIVIEEIITEELPEESKEEAIEQYVEELETEEVIEVLEEVNDIGLNNIAEASEDVVEVVAQVVEEVITIAQEEELTEEQVEVVAEVLGFEETEDVEIIAEAVKTDENVAQAVDEFVERAVENKDVENYTLADATTEIAFETFVADPISVIIDVDLENINLNNITSDMTQDQKEKAQEVIVPTLLVKIASLAFRRFN